MNTPLLLLLLSQGLSALSDPSSQARTRVADGLGYHLCPLNDVDGDKCADFAIDDGTETAWVVSGKTATVIATLRLPATLPRDSVHQLQLAPLLGDLDGDGYWDLLDLGTGAIKPRVARSGRSLHSLGREFGISPTAEWYRMERHGIGDWNGDGASDLVTRDDRSEQPGLVVLSGKPSARLAVFSGAEFEAKRCLCSGDYDHDGTTETLVADGVAWSAFLLGASREEPLATLQDDGEVPTPSERAEVNCAATFVPDMDGDRRDEILFVRPHMGMWTDADVRRAWHDAHPSRGKAVIRSSSTGKLLKTLDATLAMSECDSAAAATLPDVDRDGVVDFAVAFDRFWGAGRVIVYSGRTQTVVREHAGTPGNLDDPGAFGVAVAGIGDTDGDGIGDYLVGASGGVDFAGRGCVSLYSGASGQLLHALWKRDLVKK